MTMIERHRLELERSLATARRAIFRAIETAERNAYYDIEEGLQGVSTGLAVLMDCVIRGQERSPDLETLRTYLYSTALHDRSPAARIPLPTREDGLQAG